MARVHALFGGWTVLVLLFFYAPIVFLVAYSFNSSRLNVVWEGFTLKWYALLWRDNRLLAALENSLVVAVAATALSVVLGTTAAWLLHRYRYRGVRTISTLAFIPMVVPEIIMGISLLVFFKSVDVGLGYGTVIIAHTTFCFPFVMAAVQARLVGLDPSLEEAALDLGATPLKAFWHVIVPYLMPGIVSGALMAFALSMDELIVTYFTSSSASATLPLRIYGMAKVGLNPMINALSTIFIVATIVLLLASEWVKRIRR
ncbi:MAG TPA: ABC transporter permease [Opitutaceae bacterium]|nr:ABC transporter permease [Opitutaceae bacterium]